jgi:uncharacterized membrane protein (DUF4010 family)
MNPSDVLGLIVAALGGTAVGLERQRSGHADGPSARFAGIRTFTMLGALAGLAGWLWIIGMAVLAAILLAGAVAITAAGYIAASRRDVDGTTEVSALIVMAAGVIAGTGSLRLASGIIAVEVLLLVEKSRLHALATRIDDVDLRSGVRFGVMALVILPLLPEGPYGPFGGVRPRLLWVLVLFFSGLSFVGHVMRRIAGPGRGYLVSGLIGGLVSSTNVTLTFARLSRIQRPMQRALALGAVAANAVLYPRVLVAVAVLNAALLLPVLRYLAAPALVLAVVTAAGLRSRDLDGGDEATSPLSRNPLQVSAAVQMALLFQFVIMIVGVARARWGDAGTLSTAAVLGLTDVDALTVSMAREVAPKGSLDTAALAIAVGVLANTALKTILALTFGGPKFRTIVGWTLAAVIVAAAVSIVVRSW